MLSLDKLQLPTPATEAEPIAPVPSGPKLAEPKFRTQLKLTETQEDKLSHETFLRLEEIKREMGLNPDNSIIPQSWMHRRLLHDCQYFHDLEFRKALGEIFRKSNLTTGSGVRHVRYISAVIQDRLLGTSPFFACTSPIASDAELAKQVEQYVQSKVEISDIQDSLREAQKIALYRNECVVKVGYQYEASPFVDSATVLVDAQSGEPIKTPDKGLYVFENDNFIPSPTTEGLMLLETDPSFSIAQHETPGSVLIPADGDSPQMEGRYQFFESLPQVLVKKDGAFCMPLDWRSFLCPLKVKSIHDADTVAHLYLETPARLQQIYGGIDVAQRYFSWWNNPGAEKPKLNQGESNAPTTSVFQQCSVAEVWRTCDPDETGETKEVFMVLDMINRKVIYYNYMAAHMPERPFNPITGLEKVPDRWYGRGVFDLMASHFLYEDWALNRAAFQNSNAATMLFANRDAVPAWETEKPVIGDGRVHFINPNWIPENGQRPIWREILVEPMTDENIKMMGIMKNAGDAMMGSISSSSAAAADFNPSNTATGNQLIQQGSDVIAHSIEVGQSKQLEKIMKQVVDVILERMDSKSLVTMEHTGELALLNRNEIRGLVKTKIRLLLTKARSSQLLANADRAMNLIKDYWATKNQDPLMAKTVRPQYIRELKAMDVEDSDALLPEISDEEVQAWQQAQQQAKEPPMVSHSISAKLEDFLPSERPQAVQQMGINPGSPEEAEMETAKEHAKETAAQESEEHNQPPAK